MGDNFALTFGFVAISVLVVLAAGVLWALLRIARARDTAKKRQDEGRGSVDFVIETFHDLVSQLKAKEEELERLRTVAEDRAESIQSTSEDILRSVPGGVITLNNETEILFINPAARDILGIGSDEGGDVSTLEALGPDIAEAVRKAMVGGAEERERMEVVFRHPVRGRLLLGMRISDLCNHLNDTVGAVIVFNDLTEVRRLEERVRLREKLTHLGEMSAGIAHELRNPMAVISGHAEFLAKRTPDEDPRSVPIRRIREEIRGMDRVITEFLDFARPTTEPNRGPINVRDLLEGVANSRCPARPDVDTRIDADPGLSVSADEVLLRQALLNLVTNALEAIPETGGTLILRAFEKNTSVCIDVEDTGPGLPPGDAGRIFLPFHTTKDTGTGLGLAIVHKIVSCHGGSVEARSAEGGGAIFRIEIPVG